MTIKIISRTLLLFAALFLVTSSVVSAQDDLSDGEVLNVPDFAEQPVITVENVNVNGQNSLTTIFASDNGNSPFSGIFFDIENVTNIPFIIQRWDINCTNIDPTADISVYTRIGTSQGFENTMDGWTLVGTQTGVVCVGDNLPTPLGVGGFTIQPGETTGIAMVNDGGRWEYTDGNGSNQIYNNGELEIRTGSSYRPALQSPGSLFTPRVWNGTVYYDIVPQPIPTLSEWGLIAMAGILGIVGLLVLAIRRRKAAAV